MNMNSLVDIKKKKNWPCRGRLSGFGYLNRKSYFFFIFWSCVVVVVSGLGNWKVCVIEMNEWMNGTGIVITNESEIGGEIRSGAAQGRCAVSLVNTQYIVKSSFILYMKKSERQSQIAYFQIPILFYQRFPCITLFHTL